MFRDFEFLNKIVLLVHIKSQPKHKIHIGEINPKCFKSITDLLLYDVSIIRRGDRNVSLYFKNFAPRDAIVRELAYADLG